jgi:hypothetical protein
MLAILFSILVHSSGTFASNVVPFPSPLNQNPKGLVYIDRVLASLASEQNWNDDTLSKRAQLLEHVRSVVDRTWIAETFENSEMKRAIHKSAQKILNRETLRSYFRSDIVYIYHKLGLWDQTDLPFIVDKFFQDRSYVPLVIRLFPQSSLEFKKEFASRVRSRNQYEFVETGLLYRAGLLRDDELIYLFRRFFDNVYFSHLMATQMSELYESDSRVVEDFELQLGIELHDRLLAKDPTVIAIFNQLRENPGSNRQRPLTPMQTEIYRRVAQRFWTGDAFGRCQLRLVGD